MPNRVLGAQKPFRRREFQMESGFRNPIPTECPRVTHITSASGHSRFSRLHPGIEATKEGDDTLHGRAAPSGKAPW